MAKVRKLQSSFVAGELDPNLYGRVDIPDFDNGAAKLRNVYVRPQGGVSRREGTKFIAQVNGNNVARIVPFQFNQEQTYLLVFTAGRLDIYQKDGTAVTNITSSPISTLTEAQIKEMTYTQSADTVILFHIDVQPIKILRTGASTWTSEFITFENIPTYNYPDGSYTGTDEVQNIKLLAGGWHNDTTTFTLKLKDQETDSILWSSTATTTASRIQAALRALDITSNTGITVASAGGSTGLYVQSFNVTFGGDDGDQPWGEMGWELKGSLNQVETLSIQVTTEGDTGGEAVMSGTRGYPATGCFHKGRLIIGGLKSRPQTILMSRVGSFFDLGEGDALATDGINITISDSQVNAIRHIVSGRALNIFTTGGEYSIRSATNEPITPENISGQLQKETSHGCTKVIPTEFDGAVIFVESESSTDAQAGRIFRQFIFNDTEQSFNANNVSIFSQHLINNPFSVAVRRSTSTFPANYMYVVNNDGTVAVLNSMREQNLLAWTLFESDTYDFEDVAVIGDTAFFVMHDGTNRIIASLDSNYMLDGGVAETASPATDSFTLTYDIHDSTTVNCRGDNFILDDVAVNASSEITTSAEVESVEVGYNFMAEVQALPLDVVIQGQSFAGEFKKVPVVNVNFKDTRQAVVDNDGNSFDVPMRQLGDGSLNSAIPLYTGWKKVYLRGNGKNLQPTFKQTEPHEFNILSIHYEVKV